MAVFQRADKDAGTALPTAPESYAQNEGSITLDISFAPWNGSAAKSTAIKSIDKATAYVYDSADNELVAQDLTLSQGRATGRIKVKAQDDLRVALVYFDGSVVRYVGEDVDVDVEAGKETAAEIVEHFMGTSITVPADISASFSISWVERPFSTGYELEEATAEDYANATSVYEGTATSTQMVGKSETGVTYFYRARVKTQYGYGPWYTGSGEVPGEDEGTIIIDFPLPDDDTDCEEPGTGGEVLYADDFDDDQISDEWELINGNWVAADGRMAETSDYNNDGWSTYNGGAYALVGSKTWSDYTLSVELKSDDNDRVGVVFGFQDVNNYYAFVWSNEGSVRVLVGFVDGQLQVLASDGVPYDSGTWYHLQVAISGRDLVCKIDGTVIFRATSDSDVRGKAGLYSSGNSFGYWRTFSVEGTVGDGDGGGTGGDGCGGNAGDGGLTVSTVGDVGDQFSPRYNSSDGYLWTMTTAGFDAVGKINLSSPHAFELVHTGFGGGGCSPTTMAVLPGLGSRGKTAMFDCNGPRWYVLNAADAAPAAPEDNFAGMTTGTCGDGQSSGVSPNADGTKVYHHVGDKIYLVDPQAQTNTEVQSDLAAGLSVSDLELDWDAYTGTLLGHGSDGTIHHLYRIDVSDGTVAEIPVLIDTWYYTVPDPDTGLIYLTGTDEVHQLDPVSGKFDTFTLPEDSFRLVSTFGPARSGNGKSLYGMSGSTVVEIAGSFPLE